MTAFAAADCVRFFDVDLQFDRPIVKTFSPFCNLVFAVAMLFVGWCISIHFTVGSEVDGG